MNPTRLLGKQKKLPHSCAKMCNINISCHFYSLECIQSWWQKLVWYIEQVPEYTDILTFACRLNWRYYRMVSLCWRLQVCYYLLQKKNYIYKSNWVRCKEKEVIHQNAKENHISIREIYLRIQMTFFKVKKFLKKFFFIWMTKFSMEITFKLCQEINTLQMSRRLFILSQIFDKLIFFCLNQLLITKAQSSSRILKVVLFNF